MNEIVFKTKRGKVSQLSLLERLSKANLSYSLEDIAGEVFLDETGKSSSLEVKIPCELIENSSNFGLEPKSFGAIEEHWLLNFNLYELDAKLNSWRITWPEQTGNGEYIISLVDANDVNTGTEPGDPNDIEDPDPDDFQIWSILMMIFQIQQCHYHHIILYSNGAVASIIAALLWFNYDS